MAVAVLEREKTSEKIENTEKVHNNVGYATNGLTDEQHNARIGEVYARLINPGVKIEDVLGRTGNRPEAEAQAAVKPYLVENARADAEIFRADSPVNQMTAVVAQDIDEEEENEDLRPTQTTIQYRTLGVSRTAEEGKVERSAERRSVFSKKEKIAIAVVIGVIIAMFAIIIINSAILAGINSEMSSLQTTLSTVKASYASISDEVNGLLSNAIKNAEDFAAANGMIK